ncbi:MAG: hypothetical protein ABSG59_22920 [Verrucomicrobiota bacterium]|jgi:hypothetical protein
MNKLLQKPERLIIIAPDRAPMKAWLDRLPPQRAEEIRSAWEELCVRLWRDPHLKIENN